MKNRRKKISESKIPGKFCAQKKKKKKKKILGQKFL